MKRRLIGIEYDRAREVVGRRGVPAALMRQGTHQVQRVRVLGLGLQNLPADAFGVVQAAGAVMLDCRLQGFGRGAHEYKAKNRMK